MNDGSTDKRYDDLENIFPNIIYLKNEVNGGKVLYWKTVNVIFQELKKYTAHAIIQIDDDFILCNNFINRLMDVFFKAKEENNAYMGIKYHIGSFDKDKKFSEDYYDRTKIFQGFDGGSLFDVQFLRMFNYNIQEINPNIFKQKYQHSHIWTTLNDFVKNFGVMVYTVKESLAWHDGNEDSKMHPELRKKRKIYTKNFIDDTGNNI
jgi:hypothetical protein